ncbi:unnamed protein product [Adineta steineri]|uniref:Uncharacterized protein n=1 Tax=Adineta steineri TaxID=433720 RepID=A0A819ZLM7_9BILA|nr:unnamed protein product [Adineta steineri]
MAAQTLFVTYYSLTLVIVGTLLSFFTFIILCRLKLRNRRAKSTLYYLRTIAIFDILMLYGWNLDHYLWIHSSNIINNPSSAWLRIFICFDRYLSLSPLQPTWFHRSKNTFIIILYILVFFILFNAIFFVYGCSYKTDGVYNCIPFILMVIFNSGVIYHLIHRHHKTTIRNSRIRHRSITIILITTTFLFLIMTVPATVAFFPDGNETILYLLDGILYTYHITSFPLYLITFGKFRREVFVFIKHK